MALREHMHGARYGEVLLVTGHLTHMEADVYNTLGLNDCPDELWKQLDPKAIKQEHRALAVILNGPRYFLMDTTQVESAVGSEPVTFGRLQMRHLATVRIPLTSMLGGLKRKPYTESTVVRTTVYTWNAGREVYELISPEGTTYVMQSYSLQVDPTLSEDALEFLGARLKTPDGWQYRVRRLDAPLALRVKGQAHVIQDDCMNTYQRVG